MILRLFYYYYYILNLIILQILFILKRIIIFLLYMNNILYIQQYVKINVVLFLYSNFCFLYLTISNTYSKISSKIKR